MQKKLQEERKQFEERMKVQQAALEEERRRNEEQLQMQMKSQLNEQQRLLQFREIDAKLQEVVPKIAEINTICREIGRESVTYEPDIHTDVLPDGRKISKVVIKVFADRTNRDQFAMIPMETFGDKVYFDLKDLYEEAEEKGFPGNPNTENDGETFGWSLADSWHHLGNVYYFLLSVYNLIETSKDNSPIIDTRGVIQGKLSYSVSFELLDANKTTKLDKLEYETLSELVGKNLRLSIELKKATELPEKFTFKTKCKYAYNDGGFETKVVERMKEPVFEYVGDHMQVITEEMIQSLMYNTLTI